MHPFPPAAAGGTLRGVPYRASPLDGKVGEALRAFLRAAARTCWVCPTGRVGGTAGVGYPKGGFPTPKAFPSGGRCSSAHTGRMRGRSRTQPFLVEVEKGGYRLSPQRGFSIAPLGKSIAPSSVTFGDSFPPRGSLRRCYTPATKYSLPQTPLPQNANPNQGTYLGPEIAQRSPRCAPPRQNERVGTSGR